MNQELTTTGTVDDVASFFRVSIRTVSSWRERDRRGRIKLGFWQEGNNICFGEEAVIKLRVERMAATSRLEPGEAEAIARREWREHLQVRSEFTELRQRVARLEAVLQSQNSIAA